MRQTEGTATSDNYILMVTTWLMTTGRAGGGWVCSDVACGAVRLSTEVEAELTRLGSV